MAAGMLETGSRWWQRALGAAAFGLVCLEIGCAAPNREPGFSVAASEYPASFEHAKEVLVSHGFELDRVDIREGTITTRAKQTSGLATPWHGDQSSVGDEISDLLNRHRRLVRVSFRPEEPAHGPVVSPSTQASPAEAAPMRCTVEVTIVRERRPGRRLEPKAVRFSSVTQDAELVSRGLWPRHETPMTGDGALARRLAEAIEAR